MKTCGDYGGKTRAGKPCNNPAGFRAVNDTGKCYLHGGCSTGRPIIHGRYARVTWKRLAAKFKAYYEAEKDIPALIKDISLLRLLLKELNSSPEDLIVPLIIDQATAVVNTAAMIEPATFLNLSEQGYMIASLIDVLQNKVDSDTLQMIVQEIRERLGYET